jgi:hypothetical protein
MKKPSNALTITLGLVAALPLIYLGAYLALLNPSQPFDEPEKGNFVLRRMEFRTGGRFSEVVFWPLIEMDHRLRPMFWCDLTEKGKQWE